MSQGGTASLRDFAASSSAPLTAEFNSPVKKFFPNIPKWWLQLTSNKGLPCCRMKLDSGLSSRQPRCACRPHQYTQEPEMHVTARITYVLPINFINLHPWLNKSSSQLGLHAVCFDMKHLACQAARIEVLTPPNTTISLWFDYIIVWVYVCIYVCALYIIHVCIYYYN